MNSCIFDLSFDATRLVFAIIGTQEDELRRDDSCLDYPGAGSVVNMRCHGGGGHQGWDYDSHSHRIIHKVTKKCLTISENKSKLVLETCNEGNERQQWIMNINSKI